MPSQIPLTLALKVWSFWLRYSSLKWCGLPLRYPHSKTLCSGTLMYWKYLSLSYLLEKGVL